MSELLLAGTGILLCAWMWMVRDFLRRVS